MPQKDHGREVVIVSAVRTPIGRGHKEKGYYKDTHPNALLAKTYTEVIDRAGIDPNEVEDVIAGCVMQFGEQGTNIARNARIDEATAALSPEIDDTGDMFEKIAMTKPSKAAKQILAAVEKNKRRALIGPDAKVFDLVSRLPAGFYQRLLINGAKRQRK